MSTSIVMSDKVRAATSSALTKAVKASESARLAGIKADTMVKDTAQMAYSMGARVEHFNYVASMDARSGAKSVPKSSADYSTEKAENDAAIVRAIVAGLADKVQKILADTRARKVLSVTEQNARKAAQDLVSQYALRFMGYVAKADLAAKKAAMSEEELAEIEELAETEKAATSAPDAVFLKALAMFIKKMAKAEAVTPAQKKLLAEVQPFAAKLNRDGFKIDGITKDGQAAE